MVANFWVLLGFWIVLVSALGTPRCFRCGVCTCTLREGDSENFES